jgi:hypothetical protein
VGLVRDQGCAVTGPGATDKWASSRLNFSKDFQILQILEFKTVPFPLSKIHQTLQGNRLDNKEQVSFLAELQISFGFGIIKSGNKSILNIT